MGFASRLAFSHPPIEVGLGFGQVMRLGKDDEVEHVVEPPIATSI